VSDKAIGTSILIEKRVVIVHTGQNIDRNTLRWALGMFDA